jgi:hypothetical protein
MPEYVVILRAQSGVRLPKDDALIVRRLPTDVGPVDVLFKTRLTSVAQFSKPVPMGLVVEVRGMASSLGEAIPAFASAAQGITPLLAMMGNSQIDDLAPEIAWEVTPGVNERAFFQQHLVEERLLMVARRKLTGDAILRFLQAVATHPDAERIRRTMAQYHQALQNWEPGREILALAHLWMGVEALTPVVLRAELSRLGIDRTALLAQWGVTQKQLDSQVRLRLILKGDQDLYRKAKAASDGFEHGYLRVAEIKANSDAVRKDVANHLRESLLAQLQIDATDRDVFSKPPYDSPGHLRTVKYLRGKLIGTGEQLARANQAYPIMHWTTTFFEIPNDSPDDVSFKFSETFTPRLAPGIAFRPESLAVWGGQESTFGKDHVRDATFHVSSTKLGQNGLFRRLRAIFTFTRKFVLRRGGASYSGQ